MGIAYSLKSAARRRLSQVLSVCVAFALAVGLLLVWTRVVRTLTTAHPPEPAVIGQPGGLVWDDRVFTTPSQLKAYLGPSRFRLWAVRHPTAFGGTGPATATVKKTQPKPAKPVQAAPPTVTTTGARTLTSQLLTIFLVVGGLALGASALIPERIAPGAVQRLYAEPDRRIIALAAALAMLLGYGVSYLFG